MDNAQDKDDPRHKEVMAAINEIAREVFLDDDLVVTRATWANDVVGWSSFSLVEIILACQERFGIALSAQETDDLASLGDLADTIVRKMKS